MDMRGIDPAALAITNQMLGDGEVSIQVGGRRPLRIQESVFTGLWRIVELDGDGQLRADWLEAASLPAAVLDAARNGSAAALHPVEIPPGTMNAPALLHELTAQVKHRRPGAAPHVMNLTLFPLTVEDHRVLEHALPVGDVAIISRGFGNCRITSTATRDVWRVQYFNSMNTLILNTIEVVDVPEVALAAAEDLVDSRERLAELIAWMGESGEG
jgi:hydrogenase-1 operon protein HyaF